MFFYVCSILFLSLFSKIECSDSFNLDKEFTVEVNLLPDGDEIFSILDQFFDKSIFIEKIEYKTDIQISTLELKYLTDFEENSWLCLQDLKKACWHLKKKNKFESIIFSFENFNVTKKLTILLKSRWTFAKVKLKGPLIGKERFQHFYLFEHGETFDLDKHQKSIEKIISELKKEGYLEIKVEEHFDYDNNTKQVKVVLYLGNTERYKINNVAVNIKLQETEISEEVNVFKNKLKKKVSAALKGNYYSISEIEENIQNIKKYLVRKGYLHPVIQCKTQILDKQYQVNLLFEITFYQKKSFIFQGNSFFTSEQLLEELLVIDTSVLVIPPTLLAEDLINLYKDKGFWNVSVQWKEETDKFFFTIKEGSRAKISKISVKDQSDLAIELQIKKDFAQFLKLDFFDGQILKHCINKLTTEFIQAGFWDFSVLKQDYNLLEKDTYELVLTIDQSKRRMLSNIVIEGYPELINEKLFKKWTNLDEAQPFDISIVQEQRQWLMKYFKSKGYIYTKIKPELIEKENGIELKWIISNTDEVTRFGKTIITGCNKLPNNIILRELSYKEGDIYEKSKLDQTIKNLKSLNMFESVSVVPHNLANSEKTKTIMLSLVEDDPFEIRARLGVAQISKTFTNLPTTTYKIGGSFLWKSPLNIADILRLDADLSRFSRNFSVSYEMPWIFNQPVHTLLRAYTYQVGQPLMGGSNKKLYNENHDGFSLSFNRHYFSSQFTLATGFNFIKVSGISPELAQVIQYEPQFIDRRIPYLLIEPSFIIDNLDNAIDPIKGTYTLVSAKGFFPVDIKQAHFIKLNLEQAFIYPICYGIIGAVRLRAGHIFNANFESIIPTERFYLGGPNSIRAYEPNMVPPINSFKCDDERFWVPIGGKSMLNINAEIRFPIYKKLSGVIFNDAGFLVANGFSQISAKDLFGATGFGLRYATPLGPIRFDLGFKWKKRTLDDKSYAFYLTLGQAF